MKQVKYMVMAALAGGVMLSGCGDFLEPKSKSEFVPKDANSLNELLLGEAYPRRDIGMMNLFLNLMDDDVAAAPFQEPQEGFDVNLYYAAYTWQPNMCLLMQEAGYPHPDIYATYYERILGCNAVLDYVGDVNDSEENINRVKAQAYALRGFFYFKLVNIFGQPYTANPKGLGVPLKLTSSIEERALKRGTVEEVYAQIERDLLEAERLYKTLPETWQWKSDTRTSLPMVQLMLSRMYLYMERWAEAAAYADAVIQNSHFRLVDLNTIPELTDEGEFTYTDFHSYRVSSEVIWVYGNPTDMVDWVSDNPTSNDGRRIHPYFRASDALMESFDETPGDLRKARYVTRSWFETANKDGELEHMPQAFGKMAMAEAPNYYRLAGSTFTFGRSLRLSEAYLNYMEAETMLFLENGDGTAQAKALQALNMLRKFRFPHAGYQEENIADGQALLDFIKRERRRELCFEDHRWYDLRRWGMEQIQHVWYADENSATVYTLQVNDPIYTVPVPEEALELNADLQQIPLGTSPRVGQPLMNQ